VSTNNGFHLDDDQILWSVVDEAELPLPLREHLTACPVCQGNKDRLAKDLAQMGQMAERFAPLPKKPVSLPVEEPRSAIRWSWGWRTFLGAAVAATLALIFVWKAPIFRTPSGNNAGTVAWEMQEEEQFMTEIALLVENALPPVYQDISEESTPGLDEEFMQFVVPPVENEPLTYDSRKRGVLIC
jgi:uncharacterized protein YbaR (Trm112 family)